MGTTSNLILGGSGTIGSALCSYLSSRGEPVINLDLKNGFDLRSLSLDEYSGVDYVWFLAWEVGGAKFLSNPDRQKDILLSNIQLCSNVFAFLERTGLPFMFTSSQLVAPDTAYGITKLMGEHLTTALSGTVVRFWNVYGWEEPGEKSHVITDLVLQGLQRSNIQLMTTGEEERQFIYIDDCVRNLHSIREQKMPGPIHLTNGRWMRIRELADLVAKRFQVSVVPGSADGYQNKIDPDASYRLFQWETTIEDGIRKVTNQAEAYLNRNVHDPQTP